MARHGQPISAQPGKTIPKQSCLCFTNAKKKTTVKVTRMVFVRDFADGKWTPQNHLKWRPLVEGGMPVTQKQFFFWHQVHLVSFSRNFPDRKSWRFGEFAIRNTSDISQFVASLHFSQTEMSSNCSSSCAETMFFFALNTCQRVGHMETSCHLLATPSPFEFFTNQVHPPKTNSGIEPENGPGRGIFLFEAFRIFRFQPVGFWGRCGSIP